MQNAFTGNRWSRTAAALAYSGSGKELNLPSAVKAIEMSRPWQSMLWVLALMLLYTLVMVLVMLLFNIMERTDGRDCSGDFFQLLRAAAESGQ